MREIRGGVGLGALRFMLMAFLGSLVFSVQANEHAVEWSQDWRGLLDEHSIDGVLVTLDSGSGKYLTSDLVRANERFIPASTFKIPHTLFALDAHAITRHAELFKWDGSSQPFPEWESDQTQSTAFRNSVPWVYQVYARRMGAKKERRYLRKIGYGNASVGGDLEGFWLTGPLRISAIEQIEFLRELEAERLPFAKIDQVYVKDLMLVETAPDRVVRAKSGWAFDVHPQVGWYVGWVEFGERRLFFAMNMKVNDPETDLPLRKELIKRAAELYLRE